MARREQCQFLLCVVLLASFAFVSNASAADLHDPSGTFTGLLDLVKNSAAKWDNNLRGYANTLFWLLASIQFVWTFMPLVFRQADFGEIVGELLRFILVIGFFYALLLFSAEWADKVVDSFRTAGASAAGLGKSYYIRPGEIFGKAIELSETISDVETLNPLTAAMVALSGLVVILCFGFIAAFMGLTLIESYVVINASVLFMGFGASQWTREYSLAIVRYAVSVGAKLFVLTLIIGLIMDSAKTWQAAYKHDNASMWTMVGLALVCACLAKTIPEIIAGIISGTSMGGGSVIGGMAAAGAAGATAAIATLATPAATAALGSSSGGGGLAAAINSSFAGGSTPASAATGGGGAAPGLGTSSGGQAAAKGTSSAGVRVGGSAAPQSSGPAPQQPDSGVQQAAKQAGKAAQGGNDDKDQKTATGAQTPPTGNADTSTSSTTTGATAQSPAAQTGEEAKSGVSGHQIASGIIRGMGILSAIAVPGMEDAAGLSLGADAPQPVSGSDSDGSMAPSSASASAEPQNIIRPAEPSPASTSDAGPSKPDTKGKEE